MFETKKKFLSILEETTARMQGGGFCVGDYVKIDLAKVKKSKWYDTITDEFKDAIKEVADSEYNLKISEICQPFPQSHGWFTGTDVVGHQRFAYVFEEIAANLHGNIVVVPITCLERVKLEGNNITPGHPKYKDEKITDKPVEVKSTKANEPTGSDSGERSLPKNNTTLPSGARKDGRNQVKKPEKK